MKRARETDYHFVDLLTNVITALNTPSVKDPTTTTIPIRWLALREKANKASAENEFLLKWNMMHHLFEQEELPLDILLGIVAPFLIGLITTKTTKGIVVRLYEPVVLVAMRMCGGEPLSFFYHNQRYTLRKDRHDYVELLKHCHPESEGGEIVTCILEASLLMRLDISVIQRSLTDSI